MFDDGEGSVEVVVQRGLVAGSVSVTDGGNEGPHQRRGDHLDELAVIQADDLPLERGRDRRGAVADAELAIDVRQVRLQRSWR